MMECFLPFCTQRSKSHISYLTYLWPQRVTSSIGTGQALSNFQVLPSLWASCSLRVTLIPPTWYQTLLFSFLCKGCYLFICRERKGGGKRERNINVRLPLTCLLLRTWPTTQACALTGNRTGDLLVCRPELNPLGYTSRGWNLLFTVPSHLHLLLCVLG